MLDKKNPPKDVLEESVSQGLELFSLRWGRLIVYLIFLLVVVALAWNPEWLQ